MSNIIKCPICHEMAGLRYNENRVYQSRCQNMACRETVTVTAPSSKVAEELFSKFEKGTNHPKLSIPKKIAEELLGFRKSLSDPDTELLGWMTITNALYQYTGFSEYFINWWNERKGETNNLAIAYLNPLTRPFVEVTDE